MKQFPDVSFYQGEIDWPMMRSKTDTIIIRAGQGDWRDVFFKDNYLSAREYGMLRGIYWFYDDRVSPGDQAELLAGLVGTDLPELEIFCDWERTYGGEFADLRHVVAFMEDVERRLPGVRTGMYTGYYWFVGHSNPIRHFSQYMYLKNRPLWLAWYTSSVANVIVPAPWSRASWVYWQFGTPVVDWGQETWEIDMNYFLGDPILFYNRVKQGDTMYSGRTNQVAKVWDRVNGSQIDDIPSGTTVIGYGPVGDFVQLTSPVAGYTKKIWLSNYAEIVVEPPPPPPPPDPEPTGHTIEVIVDGVVVYRQVLL